MINERSSRRRFYLISWTKPYGGGGFMGIIVDENGRLLETINNLFNVGRPTQDFTTKCNRYKIVGKIQGESRDHIMLSGSVPSIKSASFLN